MKYVHIFVVSVIVLEFSLLVSSFYFRYQMRKLDINVFAHEKKIVQYQQNIENCSTAIDWCLYAAIISGSAAIIYKTFLKYFG